MMREEGVIEVLAYLYEEYLCEEGLNTFEHMQSDLKDVGFREVNISQAFTWLKKVAEMGNDTMHLDGSLGSDKQIRVFSDKERLFFTAEAQGFLHLLEQNRLLDGASRERVIEHGMALKFGSPVDLEQIQWVVLFVLYHYPGKEGLYENYEGLFFSEDMLTVH